MKSVNNGGKKYIRLDVFHLSRYSSNDVIGVFLIKIWFVKYKENGKEYRYLYMLLYEATVRKHKATHQPFAHTVKKCSQFQGKFP